MTTPEQREVLDSLTEAQRRAILNTEPEYYGSLEVLDKDECAGLEALGLTGCGSWPDRMTDLGLAIRAILKEQASDS